MYRKTIFVRLFILLLCTGAVFYTGIELHATSVRRQRDIHLEAMRRGISELEKPTHGRLQNERKDVAHRVTAIIEPLDISKKSDLPKNAKTHIAICTASKSLEHWKTIKQTSITTLLIPSIIKTITEKEMRDNNVTLYIAVDDNDQFWLEHHPYLHTIVKDGVHLSVKILNVKNVPNRVPFNDVTTKAYEDGAEYIVRVNDDTEFITSGWITQGIEALRAFSPPNVGVVGPLCREGNTAILTHDMVHRTHLQIFETYYPPVFHNWWLDDWITRVYEPDRSRVLKTWVVKHHTDKHGTRYTVKHQVVKELEPEIEKGKALIKAWMLEKVGRGASKTSMATVIVTGMAKNVAKYSQKTQLMLHRLGNDFDILKVVIYENDSTDDTVKQLKSWDFNMHIISEKKIGGSRTERIAHGRNQILKYLQGSSVKADYILSIDLDGLNNDLLGWKNCFNLPTDWGVCCANQRTKYYDIWALRSFDEWMPGDVWYDNQYKSKLNEAQKHIPSSASPIAVKSCFGGASLYKFQVLKNTKSTYIGRYNNHDQCEHVLFNLNLDTKKYIHPAFLNDAPIEHLVSKYLEMNNSKLLNTKSSHVLWSRGWRDIVRCPSVPDSYFNAGTETRHSALKMLTYFQNCSGLIWIRLNTGQPSDIETFVNYVLPHMTKRFTLVTTDGDNSVPSKITNYQALLNHPLLDAWFTQNYDGSVVHPKLYLFPIGFDLHTSRRDKKWRSFNGISIMKDVRNREFKRSMTIIFDKMRPNPYRTRAEKELTCIYKVKKKLNAEAIWEFYSSHVFGISPRGNGLDCHRTWEMIYFGMIPIVKSSSLDPLYADLPVVIVKQWKDVCELDLNAVYESIRGKMPVRDDIFTLEWWLEKKTLYSDI